MELPCSGPAGHSAGAATLEPHTGGAWQEGILGLKRRGLRAKCSVPILGCALQLPHPRGLYLSLPVRGDSRHICRHQV